MFQVVPLDEDHLAICILDVSGHRRAAAIDVAVSICQMLQPHCGVVIKNSPNTIFPEHLYLSPREVLEALD